MYESKKWFVFMAVENLRFPVLGKGIRSLYNRTVQIEQKAAEHMLL